jgi:hypothetical protein
LIEDNLPVANKTEFGFSDPSFRHSQARLTPASGFNRNIENQSLLAFGGPYGEGIRQARVRSLPSDDDRALGYRDTLIGDLQIRISLVGYFKSLVQG